MIQVERSVTTAAPLEVAAGYLCDFTSSSTWDPHTRSCRRVDAGPLGVGAEFDNTQRLGPARTTLRYRVIGYEPNRRIVLASTGRMLEATDTMRFSPAGTGGSTVTYTAQFKLKGLARVAEPVLRRLATKLADDGAAGMRRTLRDLAAHPRPPSRA